MQGVTKNRKTFEDKMAAEGLQVKVAVFTEKKIRNESMKDQAELMLYGHWRRQLWLSILATAASIAVGLASLIKRKGWSAIPLLKASSLSSSVELERNSSNSSVLHSSLDSFARSNSSNIPGMRRLQGASNWSELSRYAGLLQLDVHTGARIEKTDLHICSKGGAPWVLGSGAYGIVYKVSKLHCLLDHDTRVLDDGLVSLL